MFHDIEVIDFHSHFGQIMPDWLKNHAPDYANLSEKRQKIAHQFSMQYNTEWRTAWDMPVPERAQQTPEELAHRWVGELDANGVSKIVWVTGMGNDTLGKVCAMYPDRFIGMAHHDPFAPDAPQELERCVKEYGFRAFKTIGPWLSRPITDRSLYPLWEVCAKYELPVLIHFGILGSGGGIANHINMNPMMIHDVAKMFPDVTFVVPHFGCGHITDTLMLCWACGNVCIDTSGSNQWVRWVQGNETTQTLFRKYLETIGPSRILFGTDSSWFPRGFSTRYLQDQWRDLCDLNVPRSTLEAIFGGNAKRLLKLAS